MKIQAITLTLVAIISFTSACSNNSRNVKKENKDRVENKVNNNKDKGDKKMKVTELTTDLFKEKIMDYSNNPTEWNYKGERPAIIDFYATWCGPCKATAPTVEKIAEEYDGKIDVYKVDVDQQQELAAIFGVQSIPTILFIPKEGTPAKSVGAMGYAQFKEAIDQVIFKK